MPKVIPVPDAMSKPFWDAANQKKLVVQKCTACNTLQFPPRARCRPCGSDKLEWTETKGKGHITAFMVVEDGRIDRMMPDQPFNMAIITLDEDPRINFFSNLPGVPVRQVPVGAATEVIWEEVAPGQVVPEWKIVS